MSHVVAMETVESARNWEFAGGTVLTVITKSSTGRTSATTGPMHSSTELASASQTLPDMIVASVSTVTTVTTANRKEP